MKWSPVSENQLSSYHTLIMSFTDPRPLIKTLQCVASSTFLGSFCVAWESVQQNLFCKVQRISLKTYITYARKFIDMHIKFASLTIHKFKISICWLAKPSEWTAMLISLKIRETGNLLIYARSHGSDQQRKTLKT